MTIKEMDDSTRKVVAIAHMVALEPTEDRMTRLRAAIKEFDKAHEVERSNNLITALFGQETAESDPTVKDSLTVQTVEPEKEWRARNSDFNKTSTVSMRQEDVSMFRQCNADFVIQVSIDGGKTWQDADTKGEA